MTKHFGELSILGSAGIVSAITNLIYKELRFIISRMILGSSVSAVESNKLSFCLVPQMKLQVHAHAVEIGHAHISDCTSNGTLHKRTSSSPSQAFRY
jgi:hypothetical protein